MPIRRPLIAAAILILIMIGLSLTAAFVLPPTAPLRFNAHGAATSYGSPYLPLAVMPGAALVLCLVFAVLAKIGPRRDNLAQSRLAYATRWIGATAVIGIVHVFIVYTLVTTARGAPPLDPTRLIFALLGGMIALVGSQLDKVRSNFVIGIRTPWTLASDAVWARTHRLARVPVVLTGLAILIAALTAPRPILPIFALTLVIVVTAGLILLSYLLWRGNGPQHHGA